MWGRRSGSERLDGKEEDAGTSRGIVAVSLMSLGTASREPCVLSGFSRF